MKIVNENQYGIKEILEMFDVVILIKKVYESSVVDNGKVDFFNDVFNFIDLFIKFLIVINGVDKIFKELGDLNQVEIE